MPASARFSIHENGRQSAFALPMKRIDYYMTRDVAWRDDMNQYDPDTWDSFDQWASQPVVYKAGQTYDVTWNAAVIGPSTLGTPVARWGSSTPLRLSALRCGLSVVDNQPGPDHPGARPLNATVRANSDASSGTSTGGPKMPTRR